MMLSAAELARSLGKAKKEGGGWYCLCPAHEARGDHSPSLSITEKGRKLLFVCRAGCSQEEVIDALEGRGLWPKRDEGPRIETTYDYRDELGKVRYQVVRRPVNGSSKKFLQRRPDGAGGWIWNMEGVEALPYRLPELLAAKDGIFVCEGEKDVDALIALGLAASCNHGGALKWRPEISAWFKGRGICILPDNDEPGRKHAVDVARHLKDIVSRIRILELPDLPEKGDVSDWLASGGTREQLLELARAAPEVQAPPVPRRRFIPVLFNDVDLSATPRCIVEDLIPYDGLVVFWGPPKCGKSFFVFDLAMHIALGWDYCDRRVEQGAVCYIAAEGELGIKTRVEAFRQARIAEDGANPPFYLLTARLDLVQDLDELAADLKAQLPDGKCSVMILDTLNRTMHGSESNDDDMGRYRDAADRLREEFGCTVIIIHHCGIDGTRPRGHTSLTGAADAQFAVKRAGDKTILVTVELMKDGPEGDVLACKLVPIDVGFDRNGKPLSSCVVEHLNAPADAGRQAKPRKLPPAQALALRLLREAIIAAGEVPPAGGHMIPAGATCVSEELWRQYCYAGGITAGDSRQAKHKAFSDAIKGLLAKECVKAWNDWYWPVPSAG